MANSYNLSELTTDEALYLRAKDAYYNSGNPLMDDVEYDLLEDSLRQIDSFVVDIVGTVKIKGNKANISRGKIKFLPHLTPMGSLAKIQFKPNYVPYDEFIDWKNNIDCDLEFGPKLDGNAINNIYKDGHLVSITSRGDGEFGQDYTEQLKSRVPNFIKGFSGEIRGEAVIDTYLFDTVYGPYSDATKKYSNARNFVSGALAKGNKEVMQDIDFIAFQIVDYVGDTKAQLTKWGFDVLDFTKTYKSSEVDLKLFEKIYTEFKYYRENCKYQLDGIVCKMDESVREDVGGNSHHPFWALAIKFETPSVYTKILDIEWSLGKRGQLSPVAILQSVELLGTIVSRASVYNADWLLKNKCYPGAVVSLRKSGDIIPSIIEIIEPSITEFNLPTEWNGHSLNFDGVQLMVDDFENTDDFKALKLYNSISSLGIEGIGPAMATRLNDSNIDLFTLLSETPDGLRMKLINSNNFKDGRELELLIENVFALRSVELWQIIYSFGYRNCGKTISKQLANWLSKIDYDFKGLEKQVVEDFIGSNKNVEDVKNLVGILLENNVQVVKPEKIQEGLITFELTGSPSSGHSTKGEYIREAESSGKCLHTTLNKNTNYLICDSLASSTTKMEKAEKNGTKIVDYLGFLEIIKSL